MNKPKNKAQEVMMLVAKSPLPSKRILEKLARPKETAIAQLSAMAGLSRHDAQKLHFLVKG
jgi:hypothetical protein